MKPAGHRHLDAVVAFNALEAVGVIKYVSLNFSLDWLRCRALATRTRSKFKFNAGAVLSICRFLSPNMLFRTAPAAWTRWAFDALASVNQRRCAQYLSLLNADLNN